jgi:hypothetical protein
VAHWSQCLSIPLHDLYWGMNWWLQRLVRTIRLL